MTDFGKRLKSLRREHDLTQGQLADVVGVVPSAVGKYECVDDSYPSVEVLIKIADYFNVSIDYLLKGSDNSNTVENNISGHLSNSPFIQANNGGIVFNNENGQALSPEAAELLRIYETLDGRNRLRLLNYAVELEEGGTSK